MVKQKALMAGCSMLRGAGQAQLPGMACTRALAGAAAGPPTPMPRRTPVAPVASSTPIPGSTSKPAGGAQGGSAAAEATVKAGGGVPLLGWVVPGIGLPGLALFYLWEITTQMEHENRISATHQDIKQRRAQMQRAPDAATVAKIMAAETVSIDQQKPDRPGPGPSPPSPPTPPSPSITPAPSSPASAGNSPQSTPGAHAGTTAHASVDFSKEAVASAVTAGVGAATAGVEAAIEGVTSVVRDVSAAVAGDSHPSGGELSAAAGQAVLSAVKSMEIEEQGGAQSEMAAAAAHAAKAGYTPPAPGATPAVLGSAYVPDLPPVLKGTMGLRQDLTPASLIQFSIERQQGPGEDWAAYNARLKQTTTDAELMAHAAKQFEAWHADQVGVVQGAVQAANQRAAEVTALAQANAEQFKRLLRLHQDMATELREAEVRQAEKRGALSVEKAAGVERRERSAALDELREQTGALGLAHAARAAAQAMSYLSHTLTLGVLALDHAMAQGEPMGPHLQALVTRSEAAAEVAATAAGVGATAPLPPDSLLVSLVAQSIPASAATRGVASHEELGSRLRALRDTVKSLALLPAPGPGVSSGGMLAHAVARAAAWLQVDEGVVVQALGPDKALTSGGPAAALTIAELYVAQGRLLDAADALRMKTRGTAAAAAVEQWCVDASTRAAAEQGLRLLKAHATSLAAAAALA